MKWWQEKFIEVVETGMEDRCWQQQEVEKHGISRVFLWLLIRFKYTIQNCSIVLLRCFISGHSSQPGCFFASCIFSCSIYGRVIVPRRTINGSHLYPVSFQGTCLLSPLIYNCISFHCQMTGIWQADQSRIWKGKEWSSGRGDFVDVCITQTMGLVCVSSLMDGEMYFNRGHF